MHGRVFASVSVLVIFGFMISRRSLASAMANTGANVAVVKQALAHTDERTTLKAYIRTTRQVQLDARKKAQQAWFEAATVSRNAVESEQD